MPSGHNPVTVSYVVLGIGLLKVPLDKWPHLESYMSVILDGWNVLGNVKICGNVLIILKHLVSFHIVSRIYLALTVVIVHLVVDVFCETWSKCGAGSLIVGCSAGPHARSRGANQPSSIWNIAK